VSSSKRLILGLPFAALGVLNVGKAALKLLPPDVYSKDFLQEYLIARAVRNGVNPYLNLSDLAARYMGELPVEVFPHPSTCPPPVAVLAVPLSFLSYQHAALLWFLLEVLCSVLAIRLLTRQLSVGHSLLITFALFTWYLFFGEFAVGQLTSILLLLSAVLWLALRDKRNGLAGVALGLCIAIKFFAWPLIPFLAWKRKWRTVMWSLGLFVLLNAFSAFVIGPRVWMGYYTHAAPSVIEIYRTDAANFSPWAIGYKLFERTGTSQIAFSSLVHATPIYNDPSLARQVAFLCALTVFGLSLYAAIRARFELGLAILLACSVIINPLAWHLYLLVMLVPLAIVVDYLPRPQMIMIGLMLFALQMVFPLANLFSNFIGGLVTLFPLVVTLLFIGMVAHTEKSFHSRSGNDVRGC
jgi:alpha-1,2-mannosyltransferase